MAESIGNRKKLKSDSSLRSSNAISWQSWAGKYSLPPGTGIKEQTTDVVKIFAKDVGLYGLSPRYEDICLVVCRVCKQIYKMQALYGHYERRHAERLSQVLHQTMSSRKDYYGSSSSNTSLAHSSSTLEKFSSPMHGSPISRAKPLEPMLPSLESSDPGRKNQDKSKEKFKPAEKINHPHEKNYQGLNAKAGISSSASPTNATCGNIPSSMSQPPPAPSSSSSSSSNSVMGGPKKPSAFHFPGFIARKSMSNIFPVEPGSSASENSSRIISQTVSIKKTTLDSTSVYDFDDLSVAKQPSTDHGKYSMKNNKSKDLGLPEKVGTRMAKVSPCENNEKNLSTFSKGFKTPDQVSVSLKNSSHPHTSSSKDANHASISTQKKQISLKTSSPSKSSKLDTSAPNHKANFEKVIKAVPSSVESNHKMTGKKDDNNEKCGSLLKLKSSSQPLSPGKFKHKKCNGPDPQISSTLSKKEFISPDYTSSTNTKLKKRIDDIYSSSSPSSLSSRCSTPQSRKQEVSQMISSFSPLSSCKPAFSPNQVDRSQKVERSKKLSEMSKRDLLLNAKKSAKKMSPKVGNRHSMLAGNLSSNDEDAVLPSSNRLSGSLKKMELKSTFENSNLYLSKDQKRTSKSRFSIDSDSDSSISDSELVSLSRNCISLDTKASSKTKKVIIGDSCMENEISKQTDRIHRASPKFSSDGFSLSSSRKRTQSSDDEDLERLSGRSLKKQKTLKIQQSLETSPLPNKKTLQSTNQPSLSPGGASRKLQGVSKTLKFEVNISPVSNIKQNFSREKRAKDSLHGDSKRNSLVPERCHQLQHGSRLHSFPSPSSSSEPVDSLDSPLSRTPANQTSAKQSKKHVRTEVPPSLHLEVCPYQPDIHCGVLINSKFPCMNSLSCQEHSISLRRAVGGRSKAFDLLLLSQTSKPRHHSPSHQQAPSSSYSILIPSPPSSYVNPAASSNTSTSSFSHPVTGTAPEGIQNGTRVKSKKRASDRSLSSSSSSSASPPRSTFHKYGKELNFPKVLSPQRSSPNPEVVKVELCQTKVAMNSTNPEIKDGIISVEESEQLERNKLEFASESINKELIEKLLKDGEIEKGEEDFHDNDDDNNNDDDDDYGEVFGLGVCGLQTSLIRPSSFESFSKKKFQRPKKLTKKADKGDLILIGSENQGTNKNVTNGDTSTILECHPKPIVVNTFGSWNLATSSTSGLFAFRRQDLVRQAFHKIVHRTNKADSSLRLQNHQMWRRKSMNFPVRINSCLLRPDPSGLQRVTNGDCSDPEELTGDEPFDDVDPNEHLNATFRNLAPPATFLKSLQSSQCKSIRSNQMPVTSKPSSCQSNNQDLARSDDNAVGMNHCTSVHKKSHLTTQMTELPQFLPSLNPTISATVSKGNDKLVPQTIQDHRVGMRSPPHKKRMLEVMPCTTCHPLTEAVMVPCCSTVSISNNPTTLSSSQVVSYTFYQTQNTIQNSKAFNNISNSRGTCQSPKDGQSKCLVAKGIHQESDSQVCTKEMQCEKPAFNAVSNVLARLSCSPCSTPNGIPKDTLHSRSHSTKTFLTPSKFQQNGFVSPMSSTAHNMPPPSLVPNNYSVPFRNPSFSQSTNVLSSFLKSSQPSTKGLPISSPLNGLSFPANSAIFKNNNLPYTNSCPSSVLNQLEPLDGVTSLEGTHKIQFKTAEGVTVLSSSDPLQRQVPLPESIQPAPSDRKQKPSKHLQQQTQQIVASQNHQHLTVKNNDHLGHAKHPLNLVNGVDSLGSSLIHAHLQAPLASNLVNHNRHHIMNIIGSSLPTQNLIYNQQQRCHLSQDVPIFHKNFSGGFSDQAKSHSSGDKAPVQDFDALSNVDQIKQSSGKMNASSRTRKAMVGI